jgi:hypothetical protein
VQQFYGALRELAVAKHSMLGILLRHSRICLEFKEFRMPEGKKAHPKSGLLEFGRSAASIWYCACLLLFLPASSMRRQPQRNLDLVLSAYISHPTILTACATTAITAALAGTTITGGTLFTGTGITRAGTGITAAGVALQPCQEIDREGWHDSSCGNW